VSEHASSLVRDPSPGKPVDVDALVRPIQNVSPAVVKGVWQAIRDKADEVQSQGGIEEAAGMRDAAFYMLYGSWEWETS